MNRWDERSPLEDLVARAVDDWVSAAEVYEIARRSGAVEPELARRMGIELVSDAIRGGLMRAGWIEATGHWPWDCSPTEAVDRIADEWLALPNPRPRQGALFWLDNTPSGTTLGQAVLDREHQPGASARP
ncbi:MAG: hypothetical protein ACT4QF_15960 [Sporichthyaceae bacterium]